MTPAEAIGLLKVISAIMSTMGGWPLGLVLLAVVLGPWLMMGIIAWTLQNRAAAHDKQSVLLIAGIKEQNTAAIKVYETRHTEAVQMYKDNVELVKGYAALAKDQASIIHLNTQAMTRLVDKIETILK